MTMLDREQLLKALEELEKELAEQKVRAELFIVGGAAMAIAYNSRRATADIDAIFVPTKEVRIAAERVAEKLQINNDWLNDGVKGFIPGEDPDSSIVYEGPNLSVSAASPKFLLAMKLMASRADRDLDDIKFLYKLCEFTTPEEGLDLLEKYYPARVIMPRVQFMLQEMFPKKRSKDDDRGYSR